MKAKTEPKKYEYTAVIFPRDMKRKVRIIAAEMETSLGKASQRLIEMGLEEYNRQLKAAGENRQKAAPAAAEAAV